jgi:hypothetical protein
MKAVSSETPADIERLYIIGLPCISARKSCDQVKLNHILMKIDIDFWLEYKPFAVNIITV